MLCFLGTRVTWSLSRQKSELTFSTNQIKIFGSWWPIRDHEMRSLLAHDHQTKHPPINNHNLYTHSLYLTLFLHHYFLRARELGQQANEGCLKWHSAMWWRSILETQGYFSIHSFFYTRRQNSSCCFILEWSSCKS